MNCSLQSLLFVAVAVTIDTAGSAQDLRKALADADLVVVGRQVGQSPVADGVVRHRIQIIEGIRGRDRENEKLEVLDWTGLSLHNRPVARQSRLYCLVEARTAAEQLGLPAADGPFYKMVGWAGSNPLIGRDLDQDATVLFARVLAAAEAGVAPAVTATALASAALSDDVVIRIEATRLLSERPSLRTRLAATEWSSLMTRTAGETDDVAYKIALAELCAEQRMGGLVDALIIGLGSVQDPNYAQAVGRLAAHLRGDKAALPILRRMQTHNEPSERAALLLALGATRTAAALDALLRIKRTTTDDEAVDAALRVHRSRRALRAVSGKKPEDKQPD